MSGPPSGRPPAKGPPDRCVVPDCGEPAERHLALSEARKAFPDLADAGRRAPLCRLHYKEWKKKTKDARALDRLGW